MIQSFKLADLINIKHGYAFSGEGISTIDNGFVLITPGNFKIGGGFQEDKCKFFSGKIPENYILSENDFLVTMTDLSKETDTLGYSAYVPKSKRVYLHNQRIGLVSLISNDCSRNYLYWIMKTYTYQRFIANSASGVSVKHTSPARIYEYEFNAPDIPTQNRIADILSTYDDAIENNNRRIALLEKAARHLYEEWFVRFRFPGHETTKMVDGLPEGWENVSLGSSARVNMEAIKNTYSGEIFYIDIGSVERGRIIGVNRYDFKDAPGRARRCVQHGDILWSCVRPNRRSYTLLVEPNEKIIASTGFAVITAKDVPYSYMYQAVTTDNFVGYLSQNARGAAYPAVTATDFINATIVKPTNSVLKRYHAVCEPLLMQCHKLTQQNQKLTQARDLLLPRLMSGEIAV